MNRAGTLHVTWTYDSCSNLGVYVYVTGFVIYYCVITDTPDKRCKGHCCFCVGNDPQEFVQRSHGFLEEEEERERKKKEDEKKKKKKRETSSTPQSPFPAPLSNTYARTHARTHANTFIKLQVNNSNNISTLKYIQRSQEHNRRFNRCLMFKTQSRSR